jgi:hypothetical protein
VRLPPRRVCLSAVVLQVACSHAGVPRCTEDPNSLSFSVTPQPAIASLGDTVSLVFAITNSGASPVCICRDANLEFAVGPRKRSITSPHPSCEGGARLEPGQRITWVEPFTLEWSCKTDLPEPLQDYFPCSGAFEVTADATARWLDGTGPKWHGAVELAAEPTVLTVR